MKSIDTRVSSAATDKLDKINFYKGPFNYHIECRGKSYIMQSM